MLSIPAWPPFPPPSISDAERLWSTCPPPVCPFSSIRRCSFGGHVADIAMRLGLHALPHPSTWRRVSLSASPAAPSTCRWPTATGPAVLDLSSWSREPRHHHLLSGEVRDLRILRRSRNAWCRWRPTGDSPPNSAALAEAPYSLYIWRETNKNRSVSSSQRRWCVASHFLGLSGYSSGEKPTRSVSSSQRRWCVASHFLGLPGYSSGEKPTKNRSVSSSQRRWCVASHFLGLPGYSSGEKPTRTDLSVALREGGRKNKMKKTDLHDKSSIPRLSRSASMRYKGEKNYMYKKDSFSNTAESPDLDELCSLQSFDSVSLASCDLTEQTNGTPQHGHQHGGKRFVLHCQHNHPTPEQYLTPTQRKNRQIRQLHALLKKANQEVKDKEEQIQKMALDLEQIHISRSEVLVSNSALLLFCSLFLHSYLHPTQYICLIHLVPTIHFTLHELANSLAKSGDLGHPEARESTTQLDERDLLRTIKTQCPQEWKSSAVHDWYGLVFWIVFNFYLLKKMDQRTCIKFCVKNEIKCADAFRMLTVAYGEATLDRSNVYRWYKMFSEGREDVNDEERAGRPSTSTTDEKINEVEKK
ncbi:hypothetical protein LAZ67_1000657 [Cordylochernes scorpioides]|uniref:Mos1 transposase HTH domain-containing protein n=1 Tax=Cordylochernes scorpioides TaxID=51811 RepID=A0ABY6JZE8_9ARAC|nr:hypothetical protein LAZ67_1000657 [Cordylochernes scorpioides]